MLCRIFTVWFSLVPVYFKRSDTTMRFLATTIFCLAAGVTAVKLPRVLSKDVVIIGGGASGSYAAVRLRDDYGKSIVLVEKQDKLVSGSHLRSHRVETDKLQGRHGQHLLRP